MHCARSHPGRADLFALEVEVRVPPLLGQAELLQELVRLTEDAPGLGTLVIAVLVMRVSSHSQLREIESASHGSESHLCQLVQAFHAGVGRDLYPEQLARLLERLFETCSQKHGQRHGEQQSREEAADGQRSKRPPQRRSPVPERRPGTARVPERGHGLGDQDQEGQ